jgi:uncharacterized protein
MTFPSADEWVGRVKLAIDKLTATPQAFHFEAGGEWWAVHESAHSEQEYAVQEPFRFALEAHSLGSNVLLSATMEGAIEAECSLCIARYRHALRELFQLVLEPSRGRVPVDPEGVEALSRNGICLGDDLEVGWYKGSEIRLDGYFAEVVSLALPVQSICREDCAGLCPTCGVNRNTAACSCADQNKTNSPFAALEVLRGGGSGGDL